MYSLFSLPWFFLVAFVALVSLLTSWVWRLLFRNRRQPYGTDTLFTTGDAIVRQGIVAAIMIAFAAGLSADLWAAIAGITIGGLLDHSISRTPVRP